MTLCTHTVYQQRYIKFPEPVNSDEHRCEWCGNYPHGVIKEPDKTCWVCITCACETFDYIKKGRTFSPIRAIPWQKFCEQSEIGNKFWSLKFEDIYEKHHAKKEYLRKFAAKPNGIIVMQGTKGTGKTFASYALCELFTRNDPDAIFVTASSLHTRFVSYARRDGEFNLPVRLKECTLLVIDDFGSISPSAGFLDFLFEVISHRDKWNNKGTVFTTNLSDDLLASYCGEPFLDRLQTGQFFEYFGESERKKSL